MKKRLIIVCGILAVVALSKISPCWGYLLPAEQLIQFVSERTAKVRNFRLDVVVESAAAESAPIMVKKQAIVYASRPGFLREQTVGGETAVTTLMNSGLRLSAVDGYLLREQPRHEELILSSILLADSPQTLQRLLESEGVDLGQVHLARMGNRVAYVIGGSPRNSDIPQFWCDKESFWPLRLVGVRYGDQATDLVDVRFLAYRQINPEIWMPSIIEIYRQGRLTKKLVVTATAVNVKFPARTFDLEAFAAKYPPLPPPSVPPEQSGQGLDQMRRYLEKKYE
ncbi:MAG: hypothetical protein JRJ12_09220 [Deltaproteobacteria bacterium]|nr:hypothetical protein [Deltaproteobacteria bacterium]MBW2070419.1 hypothetical protein [Deltaproteobacteria bacterium]